MQKTTLHLPDRKAAVLPPIDGTGRNFHSSWPRNVLGSEDPGIYRTLYAAYLKVFKPVDLEEDDIVGDMVNYRWRIRRLEAMLKVSPLVPRLRSDMDMQRLRHQRSYFRCFKLLAMYRGVHRHCLPSIHQLMELEAGIPLNYSAPSDAGLSYTSS